jgi:hypothetical protein
MGPFSVVPLDAVSNGGAASSKLAKFCFTHSSFMVERRGSMKPVLCASAGREELLPQTVIAVRSAKTPALKNQSIVRAHHRNRTLGPQRAEALQQALD